ncbi:hypothetical protein FQA47_013211 [Oryzias melastigma]|uniref:Uncharacterized protein n=3 Tax=Oryzias melastigma TaxID=30732 RepID=A0A834FHG7_ORYME|nr:hypothetical protein FQA47_013211 [Oryzias melastigma]
MLVQPDRGEPAAEAGSLRGGEVPPGNMETNRPDGSGEGWRRSASCEEEELLKGTSSCSMETLETRRNEAREAESEFLGPDGVSSEQEVNLQTKPEKEAKNFLNLRSSVWTSSSEQEPRRDLPELRSNPDSGPGSGPGPGSGSGEHRGEEDEPPTFSSFVWESFSRVRSRFLWGGAESGPTDPPLTSVLRVPGKQEVDAAEAAPRSSDCVDSFSGRLSLACRHAGRRLEDARRGILGLAQMKAAVTQYLTRGHPPRHVAAERGGSGRAPVVVGWPEGAASSVWNTPPQVFSQELVQFPAALRRIQTLPQQRLLEELDSLTPPLTVGRLLNVFWLQVANAAQPRPQPACLLLTERHLTALSANAGGAMVVLHHLLLRDIKEVQVSLGGQHVRLCGAAPDAVLAVFTHSKGLTQALCGAVLKARAPAHLREAEPHPLLSGDLMLLSLDWTSRVPDLLLGDLCVTSRFKRVLADLLYIVHGNMRGAVRPPLADIRPLLYTSVRVDGAVLQLLLTDTHVCLLQEDGVFHPALRGASVVLPQPQFQELRLLERESIRCLFVRRSDVCFAVEMLFTNSQLRPSTGRAGQRRGSAEVPPSPGSSESWSLLFGCSSEAQLLINHLCL